MKHFIFAFVFGFVVAFIINAVASLLTWIFGPWIAGILFFVGGLWLGFKYVSQKRLQANEKLYNDLEKDMMNRIAALHKGEVK